VNNDGAVNDSSVNDSSINDGSVNNSAVNDSAVNDSAVNDSAVNDSAVNDSAVNDSAVNDSSVIEEKKQGPLDKESFDMLVNLYQIPEYRDVEGIAIKRAYVTDMDAVIEFVDKTLHEPAWAKEAQRAILQDPGKCFVAVKDHRIIGFSVFDGVAKGYFGPIGVNEEYRGLKVGKLLLLRTLSAMKDYGYGYAIIGWVNDAEKFYSKVAGAIRIPDSSPEKGAFSNMLMFD